MKYIVQLNTVDQLFTVIDKNNTNISASGSTIEQAVNKLNSK